MGVIDEQIENAERAPRDLNFTVAELARLSPLQYDQQREVTAKELCVRVGTLDKEVAKARGGMAEEDDTTVVEELGPWLDPVAGEELLDQMAKIIGRHVYLPSAAVAALAAWCLGTYAMDAWSIWPKVLVTSPEKRCGKSTLLDVLEALSCRSLVASNISPSAIFRCIEQWRPTLILDEADTFTKDNDELNGIVNAGHRRRTARVIRSEKVGDRFEPKAFSVWSPQVIAGIGSQRDTLHDRSIHIEMERKLPDEVVIRVPHDLFEQCRDLRRRCLRWALDNLGELTNAHVALPHHGNDRAQDNWQPLAQIGKVAGGDWLDRVLGAYQTFSAATVEDEDTGILLLRDIQSVLNKRGCSRIYSAELVDALIRLEESPWSEWKRGKPMAQASLARLLKPFNITPKGIRAGDKVRRGYDVQQFGNAFKRYLPRPAHPAPTATPLQPLVHKAFGHSQSATAADPVALLITPKPICDGACSTVADQHARSADGRTPVGEDVEFF